MAQTYQIGDVVILKKEHPCQKRSKEFLILGFDGEVRLKCCGCGSIVLFKRSGFDKACKGKVEQ